MPEPQWTQYITNVTGLTYYILFTNIITLNSLEQLEIYLPCNPSLPVSSQSYLQGYVYVRCDPSDGNIKIFANLTYPVRQMDIDNKNENYSSEILGVSLNALSLNIFIAQGFQIIKFVIRNDDVIQARSVNNLGFGFSGIRIN